MKCNFSFFLQLPCKLSTICGVRRPSRWVCARSAGGLHPRPALRCWPGRPAVVPPSRTRSDVAFQKLWGQVRFQFRGPCRLVVSSICFWTLHKEDRRTGSRPPTGLTRIPAWPDSDACVNLNHHRLPSRKKRLFGFFGGFFSLFVM